MSRQYSIGWGEEWPQLDVTVPDGAELALFDATYEPHEPPLTHPSFGAVRTARTLHVKLVFIDLESDDQMTLIERRPVGKGIRIVKEEEDS